MVSYLNIVEKHVFDMKNVALKLYGNFFFSNWLDFDWLGQKRGVMEAYFRISKKESVI
jgi:hypothetical protein